MGTRPRHGWTLRLISPCCGSARHGEGPSIDFTRTALDRHPAGWRAPSSLHSHLCAELHGYLPDQRARATPPWRRMNASWLGQDVRARAVVPIKQRRAMMHGTCFADSDPASATSGSPCGGSSSCPSPTHACCLPSFELLHRSFEFTGRSRHSTISRPRPRRTGVAHRRRCGR